MTNMKYEISNYWEEQERKIKIEILTWTEPKAPWCNVLYHAARRLNVVTRYTTARMLKDTKFYNALRFLKELKNH